MQIAKANRESNITLTEFAHPWGQNSIIARFEPQSSATSNKIVILGGHQVELLALSLAGTEPDISLLLGQHEHVPLPSRPRS